MSSFKLTSSANRGFLHAGVIWTESSSFAASASMFIRRKASAKPLEPWTEACVGDPDSWETRFYLGRKNLMMFCLKPCFFHVLKSITAIWKLIIVKEMWKWAIHSGAILKGFWHTKNIVRTCSQFPKWGTPFFKCCNSAHRPSLWILCCLKVCILQDGMDRE